MRRATGIVVGAGTIVMMITALATAQAPAAPRELGIKYMRDSAEYFTVARQIYRLAAGVLARPQSSPAPWAVILDVDETALDNSTYQAERAAYGLPFENQSWNAWVTRRAAPAIPGVVDFVQSVRSVGGHIAWITNRDALVAVTDATRENLKQVGLWSDDDRLCAQKSPQHTKASRRLEVADGTGDCSWPGVKMRLAGFVGDQMGDFPPRGENLPVVCDEGDFGRTCFLLPNSMYGGWTNAVTRP